MSERKIRVLIVDDSAIVRKALTLALSAEPDIEVAGVAPDPFAARDQILALAPDVLTLDIEMPRMDGVTFLKRLMQYHPMPVIVVTSRAATAGRAAREAGAVDVLAKPGGGFSTAELRASLAAKVRAAAGRHVTAARVAAAAFPHEAVIAIGASTGGTEAIHTVLSGLPENCPGVVIAQHIPAVFSRTFADRLNARCGMRVREARDGDRVEPGLALVAPGGFHMLLRRAGAAGYRVELDSGPPVRYQRPSVDVLFHSVAKAAGSHAAGAILTGMGADGAEGMLAMKRAGARTIAQDEASCVVFGMPKEAIAAGGVDRVLPLTEVAAALLAVAGRHG